MCLSDGLLQGGNLFTLAVVRASRNFFWLQTRERLIVEDFIVAAGVQSRVAVHASNQTFAVVGHGETRIRPETGLWRVRIHLVRALETNDRFRIARIQHFVRPRALLNLVAVGQTGLALLHVRVAVGAFDVIRAASLRLGVDSETELASRTAFCPNVRFLVSTFHVPEIVTMIVHVAFTIVQQAVFALLHRQRAVHAEYEVIAQFGMMKRVLAVLRTVGRLRQMLSLYSH